MPIGAQQPRRGFTLTELLIVIAITSVLAAMLLPTVEAALVQARVVACANNHQQIYLGIANYTQEWRVCPTGPSWWDGLSTAAYWITGAAKLWSVNNTPVYSGLGRVFGYGYLPDANILRDPGSNQPSAWDLSIARLAPVSANTTADPIRPTSGANIPYPFLYWKSTFDTQMQAGRRLDQKHPDSHALFMCYLSYPNAINATLDAHNRQCINATYQDGHSRTLSGAAQQLDYYLTNAPGWPYSISTYCSFGGRIWNWAAQQDRK